MSRRKIVRQIQQEPTFITLVALCGTNEAEHEQIKEEEYEAIRLCDYRNMSQIEAAKSMGVSRQTFQNILRAGRRKVAEVMVKGGNLTVGGGYYRVKGK